MFNRLHTKLLLLVVALFLLMAPGIAQAAGTGSTVPDHITLSLTLNPTTSMAITWRTDSKTSGTIVQYAPQNGQGTTLPANAASVNGTVNPYSSNIGSMNIHHATVSNLQPGTSYLYRVGDGSDWSSVDIFKTEALNTNSFSAVIFSDSQSGSASSYNYQPWTQVLNGALSRENPAFSVVDGDLVEVGQNQNQWEAWFSATNGAFDNLPLMTVEGNHETFIGGTTTSTKPTSYLAQFTAPDNGPAGLKGQAYSFDYGPVHFVVLDSQGQEEGAQILSAQKSWLDQDLKATNQPFKVVFFHKSPYPVKNNRPNTDVKAAFCTILEQNHVDLVVNGHDHTVEHTYPVLNGKKASNPADGTVYAIAGRSGAKIYTDVTKNSLTEGFYIPKDQPVYSLLQVDGGKLQFITKKADGTIVDSFSIDKSAVNPVVALSSIAITKPAAKLTYSVGDTLDLTGLVVTGTYSDGTTKEEAITDADVSGFDSSLPVTGQELTVTVGDQTAAFTVDIVAATVAPAKDEDNDHYKNRDCHRETKHADDNDSNRHCNEKYDPD